MIIALVFFILSAIVNIALALFDTYTIADFIIVEASLLVSLLAYFVITKYGKTILKKIAAFFKSIPSLFERILHASTKQFILSLILVLCVAGMILSAPFGMKVKTMASDFQVDASNRFEVKMDLFSAMDELKDEKALLENGEDTVEKGTTYHALLSSTAADYPADEISAFTVRLILFLVFVVAFIAVVVLLKKIRLMLLIIGAVIMVFPFYWMISGAFKSLEETVLFPPNFFPKDLSNGVENLKQVWTTSNVPFTTYYLNSIVVCFFSVLAVMVTTVLAAYAFARLKFPGRDLIFTLLLSMMMIPFELLVITNSQTIVRLGMKNEIASLVVPFISSIFYTYILRNFFMSVPESLYNAATVDGCSNWGYLWKVMFPMAKPSIVTIILLNAMASWNSFMWPQLVISEPSKRTLPWALICFQTEAGAKDNVLMMAATLVVLPMLIMFLCARKQIVSGVSRGGIKG